jgi:transposase
MSREPQVAEEVIARQTLDAQAMIPALPARLSQREARRPKHEARFKKTPRNFSLPPSSKHPHAMLMPAMPKSSRKPGGQSGHAKHARAFIPVEPGREMMLLKPTACRRCGTTLSGSDPKPPRHQLWELPEIKPLVTEYQRHRLACPRCGQTTCGSLPPGVPHSQARPRLVGWVALLNGVLRTKSTSCGPVSEKGPQPALLARLGRQAAGQATAALTPPHEELAGQLPA